MDFTYVKGAQAQQCKALVSEAEDRVAEQLARRNAEQERLNQERRRICDGSEELRVLKQRLHGAKMNKERAQQLLEIQVRDEKQRLMDHLVDEHCENARLEAQELEHKVVIDKMKQRERVKQINQQQIATKEAQREVAMQEYLKEKAQVQELVDRIQKEDDAEAAAKEQKRVESREMLRRFAIEQHERQEAMERAEIEENEKIAKFARDKADREERQAREKADSEKEKERIQLVIIAATEAKNKAAEELEMLRNDLHLEEHEHKERERERNRIRKRAQDREDMKTAHALQMEQKEKRKAEDIIEEEKLREFMLAKFAEDERIEQMNDQKRRVRVEAHKREAQRLIELKKATFEKERSDERAEMQRLRELDARNQQIIEEERRNLIKEYGIPLRDFLPKGTLATQDDFNLLFRENMANRHAVKRPGNLTAR